jgi:ppGpp synthetase/RelA/SpoT-type nucleotidyltranferase
MEEEALLARWHADQASFLAWAEFVRARIREIVSTRIEVELDEFLKICPPPRLKSDRSFLDKALHRGKNYRDPYVDVKDKVGLRFVVLLLTDVELVARAVEEVLDWTATLDRDPDATDAANPMVFGYKSVHYIVESNRAREDLGSVEVPQGVCCEVQIRTLLQHAHCELTHDTVYKPRMRSTPAVRRTIAKAMALIEVTDDYFIKAIQELNAGSGFAPQLLMELGDIYRRAVGRDPAFDRVNLLLLDAYAPILGGDLVNRLQAFIGNHDFLRALVAERATRVHLYRQCSVLVLYLLASERPGELKVHWPLDVESLRSVFVDLGMSLDDY